MIHSQQTNSQPEGLLGTFGQQKCIQADIKRQVLLSPPQVALAAKLFYQKASRRRLAKGGGRSIPQSRVGQIPSETRAVQDEPKSAQESLENEAHRLLRRHIYELPEPMA